MEFEVWVLVKRNGKIIASGSSLEVILGFLRSLGDPVKAEIDFAKQEVVAIPIEEFSHADQVREGIRKRQEEKFRRYPNYIDDPDYKFCTGCKISKVLDEFGYRKDSSDGRARQCKDCVNKQTKKRRKKSRRK